MKQIGWCICFSLFLQVSHAQPGLTPAPPEKIKILSWNIYMLPHFIASHSGKIERARAIGETLQSSDYDVIFFQEAFHPRSRKVIINQLIKQFPYHSGPANKKTISPITNSGLWIFSKHPIVNSTAIRYKTRYGIDAFSRKGALLVTLNVNGSLVQVVGTHLQNCGPDWLKKMQCVELYERLLKPQQQLRVPQIICGDFNIDRYKHAESYKMMLSLLDARDTNADSTSFTYDRVSNQLRNEKGNDQDLIDYILVRENGLNLDWSTRVNRFTKRWHRDFDELSDHYSLQSVIRFQREQHSFASIQTN
jgi:endonuclease/exonuclease/phosphatase family metal-dependent hydrolase